jgi:hypothetical protein
MIHRKSIAAARFGGSAAAGGFITPKRDFVTGLLPGWRAACRIVLSSSIPSTS